MAANLLGRSSEGSVTWYLPVTAGAASGDPVLVGAALTGTAIIDRDSAGYATVELSGINEVRDFLAEAVDDSGGSAIAVGDVLYYDSAAVIKINKDSRNGIKFGYALEAVTIGASDTIAVAVQN